MPGLLLPWESVLSVITSMSGTRARLHDRYRAIALATIASGTGAAAIAIIIAYFGERDGLPLILSALALYLIPILMLGVPPSALLFKPSGLGYADRKRILGIGVAIVITAPAYWVISSSDRWFLSYFADSTTVGIYSVSAGVAVAGLTINSAILTIWIPEATKLFETRSADGLAKLGFINEAILAAMACIWLAVSAAGGDLVRLLTAKSFHDGTFVIPFIAAGVFFHGVAQLSNTVYLLERRVHCTIFWWVGGAAVNLMLCLFLVPRLGLLGAASGQFVSLIVIALGLSMGTKLILSHIRWIRLVVIALTVSAAAIFMAPAWAASPFLSLCLKFPVGVVVAIFIIGCFEKASVVDMQIRQTMLFRSFVGRFCM